MVRKVPRIVFSILSVVHFAVFSTVCQTAEQILKAKQSWCSHLHKESPDRPDANGP